MISPSESNRNTRGLVYRTETGKVQILRPFGEQHRRFNKPGFDGLDTSQTQVMAVGGKKSPLLALKSVCAITNSSPASCVMMRNGEKVFSSCVN